MLFRSIRNLGRIEQANPWMRHYGASRGLCPTGLLLVELGVDETHTVVGDDGDIKLVAHRPYDDLMVKRQVIDVIAHLLPHGLDHRIALGEIDFRRHVVDQLVDRGVIEAGPIPILVTKIGRASCRERV